MVKGWLKALELLTERVFRSMYSLSSKTIINIFTIWLKISRAGNYRKEDK